MNPQYIDIHTHKFTPGQDIKSVINLRIGDAELPGLLPGQLYSAGIHPWDLKNDRSYDEHFLMLSELVKKDEVIAVGESGLDKVCLSDFTLQTNVFAKQLEIAGNCSKPVIIHCVRSYSELIQIRKNLNYPTPWILHGFNGNLQMAESLLKYGCYFSFGRGLFSLSLKTEKQFSIIPTERIFFESDDSLYGIEEIYLQAARLKKTDITSLKKMIKINFNKMFNLQV